MAQSGGFAAELSSAVHLDEADSLARSQLERVKAHLADRQWDEAIETLRQLISVSGTKVVPVSAGRFISLADYCHLQIAALEPDALALYRQRVDPLAESMYKQGVEQQNPGLLSGLVRQMFCSSWGDDALLTLGDMAFEHGNFGLARTYWERIIDRPPALLPGELFDRVCSAESTVPAERELLARWYQSVDDSAPRVVRLRAEEYLSDEDSARLIALCKARHLPNSRLGYPDTSLGLAEVRSRLVLASTMQGAIVPGSFRNHCDGKAASRGRRLASWTQGKPGQDFDIFGWRG